MPVLLVGRCFEEGKRKPETTSNETQMEYDIYHDESKEAGYWHGILFVPRASLSEVLNHLEKIRKETRYTSPLMLKGINSYGSRFECSRAAVQLAVAVMMQDNKGKVEDVVISSRCYDEVGQRQATNYRKVITVNKALGLKFIVFRERDAHKFVDPEGYFLDYAGKVETTMRMGLKGGLHVMFDQANPVTICSIHFDGHEHYGRHVDKGRLIDRLKIGLRDYCTIDQHIQLDDRSSDHRSEERAQSYDDCQFLQLTDLLIGSFRTVLADCKNRFQEAIAAPVKNLVEKWKAGQRRMENSRWFRGFCISQCYLQDGKWHFKELPAKDDQRQTELPLCSTD